MITSIAPAGEQAVTDYPAQLPSPQRADHAPPTPMLPTTPEPPPHEVAARDMSDSYPQSGNPLFRGRGSSGRSRQQQEQQPQQLQYRISPPESTASSTTQLPLPPRIVHAASSPSYAPAPPRSSGEHSSEEAPRAPDPQGAAAAVLQPPAPAAPAPASSAASPERLAADRPERSMPSVTAVATISVRGGGDAERAGPADGGVGVPAKAAADAAAGKAAAAGAAAGPNRWSAATAGAAGGNRGGKGADGGADGTAALHESPGGKKDKGEDGGELAEKRKKRSKTPTALICCCCCCVVLGLIAAAVVLPVCLIRGCTAPKTDPDAIGQDERLYNLRLLARSQDAAKRVSDMIPPLLRGYVNVTLLDGSLVEVLDFQELSVLREVRSNLLAQYKDQLSFLIPDFPVRLSPDLNRAVQSGMSAAAAAAAGTSGGVPDVVVAVIDSGFDINHPDLRDNLWVNPGETPGDRVDNEQNSYVDDLHGFDFAGSGAACQGDWRRPPPLSQRPPPSSPPPSRSPPPPPPGKKALHPARQGKSAEAGNVCTPDADVSPEVTDEGHGTHVAGIVAATRNSAVAVAGAAPKVKLMLLKVFDAQQRVWASHVIAAYAYALRMGAHIISCSFGPYSPNLQPQPSELVEMQGQAALYDSAVRPLEAKGVLLLAAAGNELTDLNQLASVGSNYLPCTLPNSNVVCVTGSNPTDRLITAMSGNMPVGVNYGSTVVDLAAPGQDVYNTVPTAQGSYGNKTGSSMATPLVAGVAALVASVVGSAGPLAAAPNYYQAARVKALLLETADTLVGLPVRGNRRLNAQRAVQAAYASSSGSFRDFVTRLLSYRINATSTTTSQSVLVLRLAGLLRLPASGTWGVQLAGTTPASSVRLAVGQRVIALGALGATATLMAQTAGLYDFELLVLNPGQPLELRWATPSTPGTYGTPSADLFVIPSYSPAVHPRYAPNLTLDSTLSSNPAGFHVTWDYASPDPERPLQPLQPAFLASFSTGLPPSTGPYAPLRNSAYTSGALFPTPGAFAAMIREATLAAAAVPNAASSIVLPDLTVSGVYGLAIGHMTPPSNGQIQLQVTCTSCRLYVQGALVIDAALPQLLGSASAASTPVPAQSGCLALTASGSGTTAASAGGAATYTLELRFLLGDASRGVLSLQWSPCTTVGGTVGPQWSGLSGLLTSSVMWAPSTRAAVTRSALRCDLWVSRGAQDGGVVPSARDRAPLASYTLPRPGARNQNCTLFSSNPACTGVALLSAQDILPSAQTGGPSYHVRCWAFFNGSFIRGTFAMRGATLTSSSALVTSVYLGSQQIMRSASSTTPALVGFNRQSLAPRVTAVGPYLPLLSFEYPDVSATVIMGVMDGVEAFSLRDSMLIDARFVVPAQL
ncbi:Intracellular serine protease, partial [Tetrabaena socialis]